MPFCPQCGLDLTGRDPAAAASEPSATELPGPARDPVSREPQAEPLPAASRTVRTRRGGPRVPAVVVAGLLVMIGLIAYGLLTRTGGPAAQSPGASGIAATTPVVSAPIVGLAIISPTDGQAVATKDVNVIGTAPPGVSVTQDVSFGLDQHATSDGTGHWSMRVSLSDGENKLVFRIGDDNTTRKEIRVTYTPPGG